MRITKGVLVFILVLTSVAIGVMITNLPEVLADQEFGSPSGIISFIIIVIFWIYSIWSLMKNKFDK